MEFRRMTKQEIPSAMELVNLVKDDFPGYEEAAFADGLRDAVSRQEALAAFTKGKLVGILLYTNSPAELCFLAVHPAYRKQGAATGLLEKMIGEFRSCGCISVTTYRAEDPKGIAARALYHQFGFVDGPLVEAFGAPCQVLFYPIP